MPYFRGKQLQMENLEYVYRDPFLTAINKPHGLLVHRSSIAADTNIYAVQLVRNSLGVHVFPVHRLDRKTAGVLLFALNPETNSLMQQMFMNHQVGKKYHAIVRGFTPDTGVIDYPLKNETGNLQEAITNYKTLKRTELPIPSGRFSSSRYSLVEITPETGRMHQIRRHFAHIFHPVIGDRPHGCNKQNRLFLARFSHNDLLLHATQLRFLHPITNNEVIITASYQPSFSRMIHLLGFDQQTSP